MPKEVLRSGAPEKTATPTNSTATAAPKTTQPAAQEDPIAAMEARLKAMNLDPKLIAAALDAERKKLGLTGAAAPAEKKVEPKAETKPLAPKAEVKAAAPVKTEAKVVAPAKVEEKVEEKLSDEEFARQELERVASETDDELPPDEAAPASQAPATTGAAPDHTDDEEGPGAVTVQNHWSRASNGAISGPIDRSDFKTPQLKIVQGSGPLSEKFNQGTLIYTELAIFQPPAPDQPGPPINFIPVAIKKYFRENLPSGSKQNPRNAATPDEVHRLGGTTEFTVGPDGQRIKPTWAPAAQCLVIIERPEGCDHPAFTLEMEIGGKTRAFAPAVMFVNGGQYRAFIKPIMDATNFILCEGTGTERTIVLEKRIWKLQVVKEKSGDNMVFNPKIAMLSEATPPDLKEYAKSLRGA